MFYVVGIDGSLGEVPNATSVADDGGELVFRNDEGFLVARCNRREVLVYGTSESVQDFHAYMKPVSDPTIVRTVRKASSALSALCRWAGI